MTNSRHDLLGPTSARSRLKFRHLLGPTSARSRLKVHHRLGPYSGDFGGQISPSFGADLGQFEAQILPSMRPITLPVERLSRSKPQNHKNVPFSYKRTYQSFGIQILVPKVNEFNSFMMKYFFNDFIIRCSFVKLSFLVKRGTRLNRPLIP